MRHDPRPASLLEANYPTIDFGWIDPVVRRGRDIDPLFLWQRGSVIRDLVLTGRFDTYRLDYFNPNDYGVCC